MLYALRHKSTQMYYCGAKLGFLADKYKAYNLQLDRIPVFVEENLKPLASFLKSFAPLSMSDFEIVELQVIEVSVKELIPKENT